MSGKSTKQLSKKEIQDLFFLPSTPDDIPLKEGQRLVAIGDIHGNLQQLRQCLEAGGLIDENQDWCGANTICVHIGDVLDRGWEEVECLLLLCKLARQAQQFSGALVILWGNHELENSGGRFCCTRNMGDFSAYFGQVLDETRGEGWRDKYGTVDPVRWAAMEPGGLLFEPMLSELKVAVKVGKSLLVHGGLTKHHLDQNGGTITEMNRKIQDWIRAAIATVDISFSDERAIIIHTNLPEWMQGLNYNVSFCFMRDYSYPPDKKPKAADAEAKVDSVLKSLEADRIVVGHTIQSKINSVFDGKVWRIDIGDGVPSYLRMSSSIECPLELRSEALEVLCTTGQKEEVAVLQRQMRSYAEGDVVFIRHSGNRR